MHHVKGESKEAPADFWTARFIKSGPSADPLRIFWAWSAAGNWSAPTNPRWTFGGAPFLCKLYVIRQMAKQDEPMEKEEALDFIRDHQEEDGSWYGRWGVNYIYGTWQVVRGLRALTIDDTGRW